MTTGFAKCNSLSESAHELLDGIFRHRLTKDSDWQIERELLELLCGELLSTSLSFFSKCIVFRAITRPNNAASLVHREDILRQLRAILDDYQEDMDIFKLKPYHIPGKYHFILLANQFLLESATYFQTEGVDHPEFVSFLKKWTKKCKLKVP